MGDIVSGFFGGNETNAPTPPNLQVWQPQYTGAADTQLYNSISQIGANNPFNVTQPGFQSLIQTAQNNPYAGPAQTAANAAGTQYGNLGRTGAETSTALNSGAMSLLPFISQIQNTAMDPQNALYNQTLKKLQDQAGVTNAQSGLTNSSYGAGLTNDAVSKFLIDWQNNQLSRQTAGAGAAGTALNAAGSAANTAQNIGNAAAADTGLSGAAPLATFNSNLKNIQDMLTAYGNAATQGNQNSEMAVGNLLSYLGLAGNQSNAQASASQTSYEDSVKAAQAASQGLSGFVNSIIGGLTNFGGGVSSGFNANAGGGATSNLMGSAAPSTDAEWATFLLAA